MKLSRSFLFSLCACVLISVYLFWFASIAFALCEPQWSLRVRCSMSWKDFRLVVVIVVILMCSINSQQTSQKKWREKTAQNHTNAMRIYLRICVMHFLSSQFLLFFRSWEMMNTVAVAALLPPANYLPFLSPWCVRVRVFLHLIFFRGRLLSNEIFHRLMHVYVDQAIRMMKTKKPVTFWKMFWEEYLVYACECVRVCTRIHIGGAKFFGHTLSFIGLDDLV